MHQYLPRGFHGLLIAQTASAEHMELAPLPAASSDVSVLLLPARVVPIEAAVNRTLPACLAPLQGAAAASSNTRPKPTKPH